MDFDTIRLRKAGGIAFLTLDRPEVLNVFNAQMRTDISAALDHVAEDSGCRCLLISGAGRGFCAGADLTETGRPGADGDRGAAIARAMEDEYHPMIRRLQALRIPVVAAVNGPAAGGGMSLALTADIVVAARSAYFVQVFGPQLGIVPDLGSSWLVPHNVGPSRAHGLTFFGDRISAEQAVEWGMIWKCVDDDSLSAEAEAIAGRLAAGPTAGLGLIKRALAQSPDNTLDQQLDLERDFQREAGRTHDFAEGVQAFLQKRQANFKGR